MYARKDQSGDLIEEFAREIQRETQCFVIILYIIIIIIS